MHSQELIQELLCHHTITNLGNPFPGRSLFCEVLSSRTGFYVTVAPYRKIEVQNFQYFKYLTHLTIFLYIMNIVHIIFTLKKGNGIIYFEGSICLPRKYYGSQPLISLYLITCCYILNQHTVISNLFFKNKNMKYNRHV